MPQRRTRPTTTIDSPTTIDSWLLLAPVDWQSQAAQTPEARRLELARALDDIAQHAARLSAYLETFSNGHDAAVRAQNRRIAKVRRALGFTYPKADLHF